MQKLEQVNMRKTPRKFLDQVSDAIKALHYSSGTGETCTYWIKQFIFST